MGAFNENLKRIRKQKGITQEAVANAVGVSTQAVSKWETASYPDGALLPQIADFLGITEEPTNAFRLKRGFCVI